MKVIFLDIDGVMNNQIDWISKVDNQSEGHRMFCDNAWQMLSDICQKTGAKVVLSSSWRVGFIVKNGSIKLKDNTCKLSKKLLDYFDKYNIELIGITTTKYDQRGKQIMVWIKENLTPEDKFVVVDDEAFDIKDYIPEKQFIKTEFKTGLLLEHCKKILEFFKEEI